MPATIAPYRVDSEGEEIYAEVIDTAEPGRETVVLSHGAGGTHAAWFNQVPVLAQQYRVVTWDSRGFGNSTNRNDMVGPAAAATDLRAVLDAVGVAEPVHLVGQSMGGWHMVEFALDHPDRVRSLALCDTIGSLYTDELRTHFEAFMSKGGLGAARGGPGSPQELGVHTAISAANLAANPTLGFLYQQLGSFHSPPMKLIGPALAGTAHRHAEVEALGVPVLFLVGRDDQIFPAPLLAASAQLLPGATFVEIDDAGHSPYFEQPVAFNEALIRFLGD